jgi:hypothetical protein
MRKQLCRDPFVFGQHEVGAPQGLGRARAQVAEVPDGRRDDVEAGREGLRVHVPQFNGIECRAAATTA